MLDRLQKHEKAAEKWGKDDPRKLNFINFSLNCLVNLIVLFPKVSKDEQEKTKRKVEHAVKSYKVFITKLADFDKKKAEQFELYIDQELKKAPHLYALGCERSSCLSIWKAAKPLTSGSCLLLDFMILSDLSSLILFYSFI